jgi:hypothetical protein
VVISYSYGNRGILYKINPLNYEIVHTMRVLFETKSRILADIVITDDLRIGHE